MRSYIIGLVGVKTSGKSTVSRMISEFEPEAKESALADKLKNVSAQVFGLNRKQFDSQDLKEILFEEPIVLFEDHIVDILSTFGVHMTPEQLRQKYSNILSMELKSPRHIAQVVGTEILRAAGDEDIHCKNVKLNTSGITVVPDCRFINEYEYFAGVKNAKFIPLYIQRHSAEKHVTSESHRSEREVFDFKHRCHLIDNNGTLSETERQIKDILDKEMLAEDRTLTKLWF